MFYYLNQVNTYISNKAYGLSENFYYTQTLLNKKSNYLYPEKLTDEYWHSDESIMQWNEWLSFGNTKTRASHLSEAEKNIFYSKYLKVYKDDDIAMKAMFRANYEDSYSYTIDSILAIPSIIFSTFSSFVKLQGDVAYGIGKFLELETYALSYLDNKYFNNDIKVEDNAIDNTFNDLDIKCNLISMEVDSSNLHNSFDY